MEANQTPPIVICQCCYSQFNPMVEELFQDLDVGYVCKDCYIQLKWAGAYLKQAGLPKCSKQFNERSNETSTT